MIRYCYILPLLFVLFSCTKSQTITEPSPFVNSIPLNGKFNINLPEDHNTGYMWQLGNTYDGKVVDYMNSVWHGNEKGVVFNFEGKAKGTTELELKLIKYHDTLEIKKFSVEVK